MALADAWMHWPDELTADLQQYYGVNLFQHLPDLMGERTNGDIQWLSVLTAQLPSDSRTAITQHPENAWDESTYLLRQIDYVLRMTTWALAGGDKSGPKPEPVYAPAEIISNERAVEQAESLATTVAKLLDLDI